MTNNHATPGRRQTAIAENAIVCSVCEYWTFATGCRGICVGGFPGIVWRDSFSREGAKGRRSIDRPRREISGFKRHRDYPPHTLRAFAASRENESGRTTASQSAALQNAIMCSVCELCPPRRDIGGAILPNGEIRVITLNYQNRTITTGDSHGHRIRRC